MNNINIKPSLDEQLHIRIESLNLSKIAEYTELLDSITWDLLKNTCNFKPIIYQQKRIRKPLIQDNLSLFNRIIVKLMKHSNTGKKDLAKKIFLNALSVIENKCNKNPLEVLLVALCNIAIMEDVRKIPTGSINLLKIVIVTPRRIVSTAIRNLTDIFKYKAKGGISNRLAMEIIDAFRNDPKSFGITLKRNTAATVKSANL